MATPNPGEPPIQAPVTDDKGNMTVPWHLWCVMMWKKIGGGGSLSAVWGSITGTLSSQTDLQAALNAKQASLGFTPENVANKTTDGTLAANSDVLYPSEKAVKTYVDGHSSAVPTGTGFRHVTSGAEDGAAAKVAIDTTADTSMTDVTVNNVSTTKHGFAPKAPNDSTKFLDGTGAYSVPPGTGTGTVTHTAGALDAHKVVIGNGTDDIKVIATGSAAQYLRSGGASADPAMASIAESEVTNLVSDLALKAPLASPALTGTPTAPTAAALTGGTQIATNAYADAAVAAAVLTGGGGALVLISQVVTSASAASVTFSSIPAVYRDLEIRVRGRGSAAAGTVSVRVQFNGDTGANYSFIRENRFSVAGGDAQTYSELGDIPGSTAPATTPSGLIADIFDYRATTFFRNLKSTSSVKFGAGTANMTSQTVSGWWNNNAAAINTILVLLGSGNFIDGSVVSLYGRY